MDTIKNKIAIVSASLAVGGAERSASLLSFMLHALGYEVHNIIIDDFVVYEYKGQLLNLGQLCKSHNSVLKKVKKGMMLNEYLKENEIATVIDNRSRPLLVRELFIKWIYGNRKKYFLIHSSKLEMYLPKSVFWSNFLYRNDSKLICVSQSIENEVRQKYGFSNTKAIYNPIVNQEIVFKKPIDLPDNYLLFVGRLEENVKNFTLLLEAFLQSKIHEDGICLVILGEGPSQAFITNKIIKLGLEKSVLLVPFVQNPIPFIQHARAVVLSSYFEGFPMSLLEALSVGTPVISVDCETGPREIIQNKYNGLLVENHNPKVLADAMRIMITNENLYQTCKNNAKKSVEHLSLETIAKQWQQLLTE